MLKVVILRIVFLCPNGHEIVYRRPLQPSPKASDQLNELAFQLHCPTCKWEGVRTGSEKHTLELVEDI
jgi:cytochrome c-type biogenesis protein CcmH/NrfF